MKAILANWQWDSSVPETPSWRAPEGALGGIDLRSLPQCGKPGPDPDGYGYFILPDAASVPRDALLLGDFAAGLKASRTTVDELLGLPLGAVGASTTDALLAELLLMHADPTGQARWKPLRGGFRKGVRIYLANQQVWREPFSKSHPAWANTLAVYQADYRLAHERLETLSAAEGDKAFTALRRYTGWMRLAYRLGDEYTVLLPDEYKSDGFLTPETEFTESFNQVDSTTLGPDLTWAEVTGDLQTVGNEFRISGASSTDAAARAEHDLSTDDHYAQVDAIALILRATEGSQIWAIARFQADAYTGYAFKRVNAKTISDQSGQTWELVKIVTGTPTTLNFGADAISLPETIKVEASGSTIRALVDDVEFASVTDADITGHLRAGIGARSRSGESDAEGDNFEAADLAAGGGTILPMVNARLLA